MSRYDDWPRDHWGDNDLDEGLPSSHGDVFESNAQIQGADDLQLIQGPAVLPVGGLWPDVNLQGGKTLIDISFKDHAPRVITVTIGSLGTYIGMWGLGMPRCEVVGVMEIGIGGMLFTAEIDFIEGVQFSLAVSKFKLSAVFRTIPGDPTPIPASTPQIKAGASAALGVVAHGRAPQRTLTSYNALDLPIGESWNLPHFSKSFRVVLNSPGFIPSLETVLIDAGGAGSAEYVTVAPGGIFDYSIEGGAIGVQVADVGAVPTMIYSLIFDLAL